MAHSVGVPVLVRPQFNRKESKWKKRQMQNRGRRFAKYLMTCTRRLIGHIWPRTTSVSLARGFITSSAAGTAARRLITKQLK
nr:MAG TPA_asm: hypothetical protein [Caudoviricetes sp.]